MITSRTTILGIVVLVGSSVISENATASSSIAGTAARIQNNSALLNQEFRLHYAHVPGYRDLMANSSYIFLRAQHVRTLAYNQSNVYYLVNDVQVIDRSHHNLQHMLHEIELLVNRGQFGHIHGRITHVHMLMTRLASDIQHLQVQIATLTRTCRSSRVVYYVQPVRTIKKKPARDYGEIRSGWTRTLSNIEGGRSRSHEESRDRRSLSSR